MREYRVTWRREGSTRRTAIFQRGESAFAKVDRILALEEVKGDSAQFETMPDLVDPPTIEFREVGAWEVAEHQPPPAPSPRIVARVREWACPPRGDDEFGRVF